MVCDRLLSRVGVDQCCRGSSAFPCAVRYQRGVRSADHRHGRATTIHGAAGSDEETASSSAVPAAQEAADISVCAGGVGDASSGHRVCIGLHELVAAIIVATSWLLPVTRAADADSCGVRPTIRSVQETVPWFDESEASFESRTSCHVDE